MQDTINTYKDAENKNYMEKCKLTKTATSWGASLNLRKFSNKGESINQSLKVLRTSAFSSVLRLDQPNYYAHFYLEGKYLFDLCETWQTVYYRCPY